ncbi:hypothetical protein MVEN_02337000 [Mycena venus]|uniref:Uncharacterized protein n=1 Tax=Mycena venus TaxID=2733690 RepID=A0A8H6X436_9AGAR|nr:hypothetical protein MVEN_02337000 [Mycena venus]
MPPRIDPNALPAVEQIKGGSVSTLNKAELFSIAKELKLPLPDDPKDIVGKVLKAKVSTALKSPQFANDPRFQKFKSYRPQTTGGAAIKNSADKDKLDLAASQKQDAAPSGAHGKLLQKAVKSDPAPQFRLLGVTKPDTGTDHVDTASESSLSPVPSLSSDEKDQPNKPLSQAAVNPLASYALVQKDEVEYGLPISVEFQGVDSQTVWISPFHRDSIPVFKAEDGTFSTSLKKLLPLALTQISPVKGDRYTKISVALDRGGTLILGTTHDFRNGNFPDFLALAEADYCQLHREPKKLHCHFLLRPGKPLSVNPGLSSKIKPLELARSRPKATTPTKRKRHVPGVDSDQEHDWADNENDKSFLDFMNEFLGGRQGGYPQGDEIGTRLERWSDRERVIEYCDENYKMTGKGKPYRIPAEVKNHENEAYHQYAGRPFTKKCITLALGVGNGTVTADRKLFTNPDIPCDADAERWVKGELDNKVAHDRALKAKFDKMSARQWEDHVLEAKKAKLAADAAAEKERSRAAAQRKKEKKREKYLTESRGEKRPRGVGDVDEEERELKRRLKEIQQKRKADQADSGALSVAKGKAASVELDSSDLDSDSSSSLD